MAVTRDTSGQKNAASFPSSPTTFPITVAAGSNRCLWVWLGWSTTGTTGITYNGVALTRISNYIFSGGPLGSLWRLVAPATGTNNLVLTHGGGDTFTCSYYVAQGVDQVTPEQTIASDITGVSGVTSTPALPCTSAVGDLVLGMMVLQLTTLWNATGTGATARWVVGGAGDDLHLPGNAETPSDGVTLIMDQTAAAGTTSGGFSWTGSASGVHVRFAMKAAAGAAADQPYDLAHAPGHQTLVAM